MIPPMPRLSRAFGSPVVAALLVVLAGSTLARAAAAPSACALLTPAELQSVLRGAADTGDLTAAPNGGETICEWTVVTSAKGDGVSAQLDVKTPFTAKEFRQQRQIARGSTRTVKHLGDSAFSERAKVGPQVFDDLWVHRGTTAFRLEVLEDLGSAPLIHLARMVLAHLTTAAR
jgi:hypothetical protein